MQTTNGGKSEGHAVSLVESGSGGVQRLEAEAAAWQDWAAKSPTAAYRNFANFHPLKFCWSCGRGASDCPNWWNAPWLLHRAHIVNKPRKEDARAAVLLCPQCHTESHGERYAEAVRREPLQLPQLLALKAAFDPVFFDLGFMQKCSIRILPDAEPLGGVHLARLLATRGGVWTPGGTVREILEGETWQTIARQS